MKAYDTDERGHLDAGAARDERIKPCAARCADLHGNVDWCNLVDGHPGEHKGARHG